MPWWKTASSSAAAEPQEDDRRTRRNKRLTRQRRIRHSDVDFGSLDFDSEEVGLGVGVLRSASDLVCCGGGGLRRGLLYPLPLPGEFVDLPSSNKGSEVNGDVVSSEGIGGSRFANQPMQRTPKLSDVALNGSTIYRLRKVLGQPNSPDNKNFRLNNRARSAPVSGLSSPVYSPAHSPQMLSNREFSTYADAAMKLRDWSPTETHPIDFGKTFSSQSAAKKLDNFDNSPSHSPTLKSPPLRSRNSSTTASPMHPKISSDNFSSQHDNNDTVKVHPLPLPPVAVIALQSGFHQSVPRTEMLPVTNQWQKGKLIGSGTYGNVYVAMNRNTGALCAMKEVNIIPNDSKSVESIKQLEQEINFLSQFKHPNIVQYYGSETIGDQFYIYLEYVHPGSVNKYVHEHCGAMTESVVRNFTRHILMGLDYLHCKKIVHRDIKGANLLVDSKGVVKLADFGMAKHLSEAASALSLKGSPYWMAPEVLQATMDTNTGYDLSVDIWSLGCTIIEMFTGKHPWSGLEGPAAMFRVLHNDPPIPDTLSNEGKDFLRSCFRRNPADRPTAKMLLEHSFVRHSNHYHIHGSPQAFDGMKFIDKSVSPRNGISESDSSLKGKRSPNRKSCRTHPDASKPASSHSTLHRYPGNFFSSCSHSNHIASSTVSATHALSLLQFTVGDFQAYALPKPHRNETVKLV